MRKVLIKLSIKELHNILWTMCSQFVRDRDRGRCFTCGIIIPRDRWRYYHAGHYIAGSICPPELFFDERNIHGQCKKCNVDKHGNTAIYREELINKFGNRFEKNLWKIKANPKKKSWDREDYIKKISYYEKKCQSQNSTEQ